MQVFNRIHQQWPDDDGVEVDLPKEWWRDFLFPIVTGLPGDGELPAIARVNAGPLQSSRSRQPKDLQKLWCPIEFNAVPGCVTLGKALLTVMSPKG